MTTVAGTGGYYYSGDGGPATNATLNPFSMATDGSGNIYVADSFNNRIREIKTDGIIETVLGGGKGTPNIGTNANLQAPEIVELGPDGGMYVVSTQTNYLDSELIQIFPTNGPGYVVVGGGLLNSPKSGDMATNDSFRQISGLAIDKHGNIYFSDGWSEGKVFKVSMTGPTLDLGQFSGNKSGIYQVVVSGAYGSVTSAPMAVTIVLPPQNFTAGVSQNGGVQLSFAGTPGYSYALQETTSLTPPISWQTLLTNQSDSAGNWTFTDTNTAGREALYYRAVLVSPP